MSTTHSSFDLYCISYKTAAAPDREVRRDCPMTKLTALPLLATNPGGATVRQYIGMHLQTPIIDGPLWTSSAATYKKISFLLSDG